MRFEPEAGRIRAGLNRIPMRLFLALCLPIVFLAAYYPAAFGGSAPAQQGAGQKPPSQSGSSPSGSVKTDHLRLTYFATPGVVHPGDKVVLVADFEMGTKMHVYAPPAHDFIPIQMQIAGSPNYTARSAQYPKPETVGLAAVKETVPVYRGKFRVTQDVAIKDTVLASSLIRNGTDRDLKITGSVRYQACDDAVCYPPQTIPLEWLVPLSSDK